MKLNTETKAAIIGSAEAVSAAAVVIGLSGLWETGILAWLACALFGALALSASLIGAFEIQRQRHALERWLAECSDAECWFAGYPDAVDAVRYVRDAAMGGKAKVSDVRDAMFGRSLHAHVHVGAQAATTGPVPDDTRLLEGDMLVSRAALIARHVADVQRLNEFRPLPPTPTHFEGFLPSVDDRIAYKFLSAEVADAS